MTQGAEGEYRGMCRGKGTAGIASARCNGGEVPSAVVEGALQQWDVREELCRDALIHWFISYWNQ